MNSKSHHQTVKHSVKDPRRAVASKWVRRGLITIDGEKREFKNDEMLFRFIARVNRTWRAQEQQGDMLQKRDRKSATIEENSEGGMVAIVYGGRDCDMSQWDNCVTVVPATVTHVEGWEKDYMENAEGNVWWHLERPSVANAIESSSRDLALEAFEDGHPHLVRP